MSTNCLSWYQALCRSHPTGFCLQIQLYLRKYLVLSLSVYKYNFMCETIWSCHSVLANKMRLPKKFSHKVIERTLKLVQNSKSALLQSLHHTKYCPLSPANTVHHQEQILPTIANKSFPASLSLEYVRPCQPGIRIYLLDLQKLT